MNFERKPLLAAVSAAAGACAKKATLPILSTVRLTLLPEGLRCSGTDLDLSLRVMMPLEFPPEEKWDIAVSGARLKGVLEKMEADEVTLAIIGGVLSLRSGGIFARLHLMDAVDVPPAVKGADEAPGLSMEQKELHRLLSGALEHASTDGDRYVLNGVLLTVTALGDLEVIGTNGRTLAVLTEVDSIVAGRPDATAAQGILPSRAAALLGKLLRGDEVCTLSYTAEAFTVLGGRFRLTGRCVAGNFPNWRQVVPVPQYEIKHFDATQVKEMVRHMLPVMEGSGPIVELEVDPSGEVTVSAATPDIGEMRETRVLLKAFKTPALRMRAAAQYLLAALPDGLCTFGYSGDTQPLKLTSHEHPRMAVMMPMAPEKHMAAKRTGAGVAEAQSAEAAGE